MRIWGIPLIEPLDSEEIHDPDNKQLAAALESHLMDLWRCEFSIEFTRSTVWGASEYTMLCDDLTKKEITEMQRYLSQHPKIFGVTRRGIWLMFYAPNLWIYGLVLKQRSQR